MAKINAYLNFKNNCREAMEFYKGVFGGTLTMQTFGESPMSGQTPPELKDKIMHAMLTSGDILLMASDSIKPENYVIGNAVILSANCDTEDEIKTFFEKLSSGGKVTMPLADQFWGATFGMLTDKFGLHWMFNHDKTKK